MYTIEIAAPTNKVLIGIRQQSLRNRLLDAIAALADNPRPVGYRKMVGSSDLYRIRVGDWRVVYEIRDEQLVVLIIDAAHRKDIYR